MLFSSWIHGGTTAAFQQFSRCVYVYNLYAMLPMLSPESRHDITNTQISRHYIPYSKQTHKQAM